jgi:MFS family permease
MPVKHNSSFQKLFYAEIVSCAGTQVSAIALPIFAVLDLKVSPIEVGRITAIENLPFLFFSFLVGIYVDRYGSKKFLVTSDFIRFLFAISFSWMIAYHSHSITIIDIYMYAFLLGTFSTMYNVSGSAFLVEAVHVDYRLLANSRLSVVTSIAETFGPGGAAVIINCLGVAPAFLFDGLSYLFSFILVGSTRSVRIDQKNDDFSFSFFTSIKDGLVVFKKKSILYWLFLAITWNFLIQFSIVNFVIFALHQLRLSVAEYGIILSLSGVGFFIGSKISNYISSRYTLRPSAALAMACFYVTCILTPLFAPFGWSFMVCCGCFFGGGACAAIYIIFSSTARQLLVEPKLQGKVSGLFQTAAWGSMPFGAIIGGLIGTDFGTKNALLLMGVLGLSIISILEIVFRKEST